MQTIKIDDNQTLLSDFDMKLLYVTEAEANDLWHSTPHIHPFAEIFYVTQGQGLFWVEGKTVTVEEDDIILVNANINHTELKDKNYPFSYIVLGISGINFDRLDYDNYAIINYSRYKNDILHYLRSIVSEANKKEEHYELIINKLLEILVINMMRRDSQLAVNPELSEKISLECAYVQNYIDKNYAQRITLDYLASLTHNSKYYLAHAFKEYSGQSIIEYLITRRLEEAKSLLRTTNHPIGAIATMVGYETTSYFSSSFKERIGVSPLKYRKDNQSQ